MSEIVQELDNQLKIILHWLNRFLTHVSNKTQGLLGAAMTCFIQACRVPGTGQGYDVQYGMRHSFQHRGWKKYLGAKYGKRGLRRGRDALNTGRLLSSRLLDNGSEWVKLEGTGKKGHFR